jgi:transcriptional regulator with XRE-family HTH domain
MLFSHFQRSGMREWLEEERGEMASSDAQIGVRIKELRQDLSMTQAELAELLGLDQSAVSRIEEGRRALTARELALASEALEVTVGQLLEEEKGTPALLRATDANDKGIAASLRVFNACIDEYRGIEALVG